MNEDEARIGTVEQVADHLYGLDPDQFVAARDQSVKDLRAEGDDATAKATKALRRPTVAAWAVNRLVRVHPEVIDELIDVTRELEDMHRAALAGQKGDLRPVSERRQRILDNAVKRSQTIIDEAGRSSSAHADDIVRTLQASSDPALAQQLRDGRLVAALEPVSTLDGLTAWFHDSGTSTSASKRERQREQEQATRAAEEDLAQAERHVRDAEVEVDRLQNELRAAKRRVERATRQRGQLQTAAEDARRALADE